MPFFGTTGRSAVPNQGAACPVEGKRCLWGRPGCTGLTSTGATGTQRLDVGSARLCQMEVGGRGCCVGLLAPELLRAFQLTEGTQEQTWEMPGPFTAPLSGVPYPPEWRETWRTTLPCPHPALLATAWALRCCPLICSLVSGLTPAYRASHSPAPPHAHCPGPPCSLPQFSQCP